jgi:hypothetical protein
MRPVSIQVGGVGGAFREIGVVHDSVSNSIAVRIRAEEWMIQIDA